MPRNSQGLYSKPPNTQASSGATITSFQFNATVDDLVRDANASRPISAGGTGATTADGVRTALGLAKMAGTADDTAGRLMILGAYGLGARAITPPGNNVNNITRSGYYAINSSTTGSPFSGRGVLYHGAGADGDAFQMAAPTTNRSDPRMNYRVLVPSAGGWSGWAQPLSEVLRGSNSRGNFVRYSDGTQECWRTVSHNMEIDTGFMGGRRSQGQVWDFPSVFAAEPVVLTAVLDISAASVVLNNGVTVDPRSGVGYFFTAFATQPIAARSARLYARGRWE